MDKYEYNFNHHLRLLLDALDYYAATETVALGRLCAQLAAAGEGVGGGGGGGRGGFWLMCFCCFSGWGKGVRFDGKEGGKRGVSGRLYMRSSWA
jgi:hypothetical protein